MAIIEFDGIGENLIQGVRQATDALRGLKEEAGKANKDIAEGAKKNAEAIDDVGASINTASAAYSKISQDAKAGSKATTDGFKQASTAAKQAGTTVKEAGKEIKSGFDTAASGTGSLTGALGGVKAELNSTFPLIGKLASLSKVVGTSITVALGPIGIAIAAIVAGFALLTKVFFGTERGADALQKVTSIVATVFDRLLGIVQTLAFAMADAFNDPQQALSDLGDAIKEDLSNRVQGLIDSFKALGDAIIGAFTLDLDRVSRGVDDFTESTVQALTGVDDAVGKAGRAFNRLGDEISQAAKDGERIFEIGEELEALAIRRASEEAKLNRTISEQLAIARDVNKTSADRKIAAEEAIAAQEKLATLAREENALAIERITLQQKQNDTDFEGQLEKAKLLAEADQIEANRIDEGRRARAIIDAANKEVAEKAIQLNKQRRDEFIKVEEDIAKARAALEQETASPEKRLELQRQAADAEVAILEKRLKDSNAALGRGNKLTEEQDQELANIRILIAQQYEREVEALQRENTTKRIALIADESERETAAFEAGLRDRVEALRIAGATVEELEAFQARSREEFAQQQITQAIKLEEDIAFARIGAIQRGAESEAQFRFRIEQLKLDTQEDFTQKRLDAIANDTSKEAELTRLQLQGVINEITKKRKELADSVPSRNIYDLLGLKVDESQRAAFESNLKAIGAAVSNAITASFAAQAAVVQQQISLTDQLIADQRRRKDELTNLLAVELEAQKAGYASNADAIRAEIALVDQAEQESLEKQRLLAEEQRKIQRKQAIADSIMQASNLATAVSALFAKEALKGAAGVILAIGTAATLVGTFLSIRAKMRAASADVPEFKDGTTYVERGKNRRGVDTIPAMLNEGEAVIPTKHNRRFPALVEGLVEGDMAKMQRAALEELLAGTGIGMSAEKVAKIVRVKERVLQPKGNDNAVMEKRLKELTEELREFKAQERDRERPASTKTTSPTRTTTRR